MYYTSSAQTQTAGTEIVTVSPIRENMIAVCCKFSYEVAGTEHDAYVMRCRGVTTTSSYTASGDTTMELAKIDPGKTTANVDEDLATADWIAFENEYGKLEVREISSVSGSTVTLASAPTDDVAEGAKVYAFYELAVANHGAVQIRLDASSHRDYEPWVQGGIPHQDGIQNSETGVSMPILLAIDNVTAAGNLDYVKWTFIDASEDY